MGGSGLGGASESRSGLIGVLGMVWSYHPRTGSASRGTPFGSWMAALIPHELWRSSKLNPCCAELEERRGSLLSDDFILIISTHRAPYNGLTLSVSASSSFEE